MIHGDELIDDVWAIGVFRRSFYLENFDIQRAVRNGIFIAVRESSAELRDHARDDSLALHR